MTVRISQEDCTKNLKEIKQNIFENTCINLSISSVHRARLGISYTFKILVLSPIIRNTNETIEKNTIM